MGSPSHREMEAEDKGLFGEASEVYRRRLFRGFYKT